jgi:hypothetical protein
MSSLKDHLSASIAGLAFLAACHATVPTRPEELEDGSFAIKLSGVVVAPKRVDVEEVVTGTACRIGEFIRLDSRSMNRRFLIRFPTITSTSTRYEFAYPQLPSGAQAHLNVGRDIDAIASLNFLHGFGSVVARSPFESLGSVQALLGQYVLDIGPVGDSLTASGVFRAVRCSDWPYPQQ